MNHPEKYIIAVCVFLLVLGLDLLTDSRLYYSKKKVNHTRGLILRLIGLSPCVYLLGWLSIPMVGLSFLILFNGLYNLIIGQKWEFVGTTSRLDRLQAKLPFWIKYVLLICSIILYVKFRS